MRILVVEDDEVIASQIGRALQKEGHRTRIEHDGEAGLQAALEHPYGLILLDWMMPGLSGIEVCRRLRAAGLATPILMLTARDEVESRVEGLDGGADDYLVKPFALAELMARVRALGRRESDRRAEVLQAADLVLDARDRTATRAGHDLKLTPREFDLLEALIRRPGQILTRESILERVWNEDRSSPGSVNFHVVGLRRKVDDGHSTKLIHTVHGVGYVLRSEEEGA